jgi:zinc and cadmium transporter
MPSTLSWIIIVTLINGLLAFAGIFFYYIFRKNFDKILVLLVSFTTGTLLGGALIHFLPEALGELSLVKTTVLAIIGFIVFLLLETFLHWHHCHDGHCDQHTYPYLLLWGDGIHNFIDGLIIASSFIISIKFGIISSLLILIHELPQEISDFGVLIYGGLSKGKALLYNFISQLTAVVGGLIGFYFLGASELAVYLLPIAAGGFLYIAISDLIPEIFKEKRPGMLIVNLIAIIIGIGVLLSAKLAGG